MNRREALRTLAAGSAAGAMAGGLVALSTPAAEASVDRKRRLSPTFRFLR